MTTPAVPSGRRAERRAPMALAVLVAAILYLFIPRRFILTEVTHILYPTLLFGLLLVLVIGDPGRIDRDKRWLRVVTTVLITIITIGTFSYVIRLVIGIMSGAAFATASQLLLIGVIAWLTSIIAFSLWYWHLDAGGPAARLYDDRTEPPAFRFPEQDLDVVDDSWYPQFIDYLFLSFNTATALSPSDVSPIRRWSKLLLMTESSISIIILVLVVARAVNVL